MYTSIIKQYIVCNKEQRMNLDTYPSCVCDKQQFTRFRVSEEPVKSCVYPSTPIKLNKLDMKRDPSFYPVDPNDLSKGYTAQDARLVDAPRGIRMALNEPPYTDKIDLSTIYDENPEDEGEELWAGRDYTKVHRGQIQYYLDCQLADTMYRPVYDIPSKVTASMWCDPMNNIKPQFDREPINPEEKYSCLSSISDSTHHMEDIMAHQQQRYDKTRWSTIWGKPLCCAYRQQTQ